MGILKSCPSCGMESGEIRCPRCNTLKVLGCTGSCTLCKSGCDTCEPEEAPSEKTPEDAEHPGTPLTR